MHAAAMKGFTANLEALPTSFRHGPPIRALDLGGADVNGTVHATLAGYVELDTLDVLDIQRGAGVNIVGDARELSWWYQRPQEPYDIVISTEMLEHLEHWQEAITTVATVLRRGGWFVGTCAGPGRRPHGARGEYDPPAGEFYGNVGPTEVAWYLGQNGFDAIWTQYENDPTQPHGVGDTYWRARRAS